MNHRSTCMGLATGLSLLIASITPAEPPAEPVSKLKTEQYEGKVVALTDVLKRFGIEADVDAAPFLLGLELKDGKIPLLLKDSGSRLFFNDKTLLDRPMRIQGRIIPQTGLLQVTRVQSLKDGKPHELYYWCDVCAIKRFSKDKSGICECCGGPMELKEVPVQADR